VAGMGPVQADRPGGGRAGYCGPPSRVWPISLASVPPRLSLSFVTVPDIAVGWWRDLGQALGNLLLHFVPRVPPTPAELGVCGEGCKANHAIMTTGPRGAYATPLAGAICVCQGVQSKPFRGAPVTWRQLQFPLSLDVNEKSSVFGARARLVPRGVGSGAGGTSPDRS
jgi:hypothetical protein